MVSTGKEGVIYNGLSDWLYEGTRGAGRRPVGAAATASRRFVVVMWTLSIKLRFLELQLNSRGRVEPRGAAGGRRGPAVSVSHLVARCAGHPPACAMLGVTLERQGPDSKVPCSLSERRSTWYCLGKTSEGKPPQGRVTCWAVCIHPPRWTFPATGMPEDSGGGRY